MKKYYIPRTVKEYRELIWKNCRECTGRKRTMAGDCRNDSCDFYGVYSMPRQMVLKADYNEYLTEMFNCAEIVADRGLLFTIHDVKKMYYLRNGNGNSLNWGNFAQRKNWDLLYERCGEVRSDNERSHGDKCLLWKKRGNL